MHAIVLKYFVEVARSGSVRKAAERLHVAASAVNRQILQLEDELSAELFDRRPGGLRLNAAGERLLAHVQSTLHGFQVARTEIDALKGERTGHIKLVAMDSLFEDILPTLVEEFSDTYPAVTYTITTAPPSDVAAMVVSGQADIGCTFLGSVPHGARVAFSAAFPLGVVMPPGHPLTANERVSLEECAMYPFLRSSTQLAVSKSVSPEFAQFWEETLPITTCTWTPMLKRLIAAGMGISVFTKIAFIDELARGELAWRPFDIESLNGVEVGILLPARRPLPAITQQFVARLTRKLRQVEAQSSAA